MITKRAVVLLAISLWTIQTNAQEVLWMRYPAISPDGKTIAFGYKGDIYKVDAAGGTATALTLHSAQDMMPVWSRDGKQIAFSSDRYGNFDVFVMPATGGEPTRLTHHSAGDFPYDFTADGSEVLFGSSRMQPAASVRFYSPRLFQNLYTVSVKGGRAKLLTAAGAENAHFNSKGDAIVFQDRKGYEDPWRKHHTSSVTRDLWMMDVKAATYRQLSGFNGEDREPVLSPDDKHLFYLSEKNGAQNIYKLPLVTREAERQLTQFKDHPVRHLSMSKDATLCFTWNGSMYTLKDGSEPKKVSITILNDGRGSLVQNVPITGNVSEFEMSPNGKEIAFVVRGEVFVVNAEGGSTKRITNTPGQERMISWGADSKTLYYSTERGRSWDIYKATMVRKEESYFYAATLIKEEAVVATDKDEFQPHVSPDGKEIAYLEERNTVKIYNIASKESRLMLKDGNNFSYSDGDQYYEWSPDSKWLAINDGRGVYSARDIGLCKVDRSRPPVYPINSGFGDGQAKFFMDGKMMTWSNNREGRKSVALQGSRELDIYAAFFDQEAYDKFVLSKEDVTLREEMDKKDTAKVKRDSIAKKNWLPDVSNLDKRRVKLTVNSVSLADYTLSKDATKLYYLAAFEKGYDLWVTDLRTRETKILAKVGASSSSLQMSRDGKTLLMANNGSLVKIDETGKVTPVGISGEMMLDEAAERAYIFNHAWLQVKKKFYDPKLHGIDWEMYRKAYERFLPHITNNYDFQELLSEILGELNGSHTGGRYSPRPNNPDITATIGIIPDETFTGTGVKVDEVLLGGPLDNAASSVKAGHIIEQIDGVVIDDKMDWYSLLNRKAGKRTLLSMYDPTAKTRYEETLKPISAGEEAGLMYSRWVKAMEDMTEKLSGGKIGYVHVQGMNDGSFREAIDKVLGKNLQKEALIVDTRFNGGGWLHEDLSNFLDGKPYATFRPYGYVAKGGEPRDKWSKPSAVLMSEGNYSDAHAFPYAYRAKEIGKLIGMPVPGTSTAVWWETQIDPTLVFGIPMIAFYGVKEDRPLENLQLEPDIKVQLKYEDFLKGKDTQLEAAVKHLLEEAAKK
ncbi:MAG: peptidase S41 [Bacteroidetes bacterium]|nr:MAG: peptidase S41 [Bacteroidota bacterium]